MNALADDPNIKKTQTAIGFFTASQISTWSIEQIIKKLGSRTPNFEQSQKEFRIAFVLVTDGEDPIDEMYLDATQLFIEEFTKKSKVSTWFRREARDDILNFWEATRGIATLDQGNLRSFRK